MNEIVVKLPGADAPGFLRRMQKSRSLLNSIDATQGFDAVYATWDAIVDWLVGEGFVMAPDGVDVREAMLDMSQNDIVVILWALAGISIERKAAVTVDPQSAA
jgi:hypothetical protein